MATNFKQHFKQHSTVLLCDNCCWYDEGIIITWNHVFIVEIVLLRYVYCDMVVNILVNIVPVECQNKTSNFALYFLKKTSILTTF